MNKYCCIQLNKYCIINYFNVLKQFFFYSPIIVNLKANNYDIGLNIYIVKNNELIIIMKLIFSNTKNFIKLSEKLYFIYFDKKIVFISRQSSKNCVQ